MDHPTVSIRIQGDFALFVRPESKVERQTYEVPTPSAARGILEAVYWHPQFTWRIREIQVLNEIKTFSLLRNEVNSKMSPQTDGLFADQDRSQRFSVCLKDVDYVFIAEVIPKVGTEPAEKHRDIFRRRVAKGQCYHRPALGSREFAAEFGPAEGAPAPSNTTKKLGLMLWDIDFSSGRQPYFPLFFDAEIKNGVLAVPPNPIGVGA